MTSIVLELQRDAMDSTGSVSDLLRKALVVARKLKQPDFQKWIEAELNGYSGDVTIPKYRELVGQCRAWNPFHGWVPVIVDNAELAETVSTMPSRQAISEIESVRNRDGGEGSPRIPFHPAGQQVLRKLANSETEFALFVDMSALSGIIDGVRDVVLSWALKLEEDGIVGDGLSFSPREQATAAKANYNVTNFFGSVSQPQVHQAAGSSSAHTSSAGLDIAGLKALVELVRESTDSLALDAAIKAELNAELSTLDAQLASPKPKTGIIRGLLESVRRIVEGATGSAAGSLLVEIGKHMIL